jgi:sulfopropanediol 3-dehydrogenase
MSVAGASIAGVAYRKSPGAATPAGAGGDVGRIVSDMLEDIEKRGVDAVREHSARLDQWEPEEFVVGPDEIAAAAEAVPQELRDHIEFAQRQIRRFAEAQLETLSDLEIETAPGVVLGHRNVPVRSVGAYVPGGRYPMLASAFMTILTAKVAGVERIVACAPPRRPEGGVHPYMLHAMATSGADVIVCLGGVQALGTLAFGAGIVDPVDMIVGPGNAYVAEAKRQLFGRVGIDLHAGPTEILVLTDDSADPELVATDLLAQAEHGPDSPAGLVTTSAELADAVLEQVERLLAGWPTAEVAGAAWRDHGWVAVAESEESALALANEVAPEHLELQVEDARLDWYRDRLYNYGGLFVGEEATVVYGDKSIGTNHVLPTARAARFTGGLWAGKFLKTLSYQRVTREGTEAVAPAAAAISRAEGFGGHAISADVRLERAGAEADVRPDR